MPGHGAPPAAPSGRPGSQGRRIQAPAVTAPSLVDSRSGGCGTCCRHDRKDMLASSICGDRMSSEITLVDRDYELSLLKSALSQRESNSSGTVVVSGGVGCGKSALLEHFVDHATAQGALLLRAFRLCSDATQHQAMLRRWMNRLAAFSTVTPADPVDPYPAPRGRLDIEHDFADALERVDAGRPVVVCVDDVQDGDRESLYQLLQLTRRGRAARML